MVEIADSITSLPQSKGLLDLNEDTAIERYVIVAWSYILRSGCTVQRDLTFSLDPVGQ